MELLETPIVLDVTLRDGGYLNGWQFKAEHVIKAIVSAIDSGADIIEVGYLDNRKGQPLTATWSPENLEKLQTIKGNKLIALMCRPSVENPTIAIKDRVGLVDLIRIPVDLRNTFLANRIAEICAKNNIPCSFNITNISCFDDDQIYYAFRDLSDQVKVVYIADSRGALQPDRVKSIYDVLKSVRTCMWGYHAHNNLGLAVAATRAALESGVHFIDGSLLGIGLGGRNLDLSEAVTLAAKKRPHLQSLKAPDGLTEYDLGVDPPGSELELYYWTGIKNFKMEWAMMMQNCIGLDQAIEMVKQAPDYPMFSPAEYMPFVDEKIWEKLTW